MDSEKRDKVVPPYVAYKTLRNFLDKFKQALPARIDRDSMGTMSGANQSQITSALKSLDLISENGLPTEKMKLLVKADESARPAIFKDVLTAAYPFVFAGDFDFSAVTVSHLREAFEKHTGATGETVTRCIGFLKDAALDAGITVSPFLKQRKPRAANGTRTRRPSAAQATIREVDPPTPTTPLTQPPKATDAPRYSKVLPLPQAGGSLILSGDFDPFALRGEERDIFYKLVDLMAEFAKTPA
jgi:hypothetical protein